MIFNESDPEAVLDMQMRRGKDAERLMKDPLLVHVLDSMEANAVKALKALKPVKPKEFEAQEALCAELRAIVAFKSKFTQYLRTGREAEQSLLARAKAKAKVKFKTALNR